ncbi:hypothetical protein WJX73_005039 [Symbiochloris irregularis]|uniref:Uncharacterized protein n=1 Tax=Symbiochloris irregularis TaxID=706552 RepID=A0AAW1NYI5_9CHLO
MSSRCAVSPQPSLTISQEDRIDFSGVRPSQLVAESFVRALADPVGMQSARRVKSLYHDNAEVVMVSAGTGSHWSSSRSLQSLVGFVTIPLGPLAILEEHSEIRVTYGCLWESTVGDFVSRFKWHRTLVLGICKTDVGEEMAIKSDTLGFTKTVVDVTIQACGSLSTPLRVSHDSPTQRSGSIRWSEVPSQAPLTVSATGLQPTACEPAQQHLADLLQRAAASARRPPTDTMSTGHLVGDAQAAHPPEGRAGCDANKTESPTTRAPGPHQQTESHLRANKRKGSMRLASGQQKRIKSAMGARAPPTRVASTRDANAEAPSPSAALAPNCNAQKRQVKRKVPLTPGPSKRPKSAVGARAPPPDQPPTRDVMEEARQQFVHYAEGVRQQALKGHPPQPCLHASDLIRTHINALHARIVAEHTEGWQAAQETQGSQDDG